MIQNATSEMSAMCDVVKSNTYTQGVQRTIEEEVILSPNSNPIMLKTHHESCSEK